jgi:hypothetical protein
MYLTAIGLTPGGSSTVHIYTQTIHRIQRTDHTEKWKVFTVRYGLIPYIKHITQCGPSRCAVITKIISTKVRQTQLNIILNILWGVEAAWDPIVCWHFIWFRFDRIC